MTLLLVVMGGLPATGKTTLSAELARRTGAVHLRVDTIEQAVVDSGLATRPVGPVGYTVGYAMAADHLRQGLWVVAESVNPLAVTRDAWRDVAVRTGAKCLEVELRCSDAGEHEHRVTTRESDVQGLRKPGWDAVRGRDYEPWNRPHQVLDTAGRTVADCVRELLGLVAGTGAADSRR